MDEGDRHGIPPFTQDPYPSSPDGESRRRSVGSPAPSAEPHPNDYRSAPAEKMTIEQAVSHLLASFRAMDERVKQLESPNSATQHRLANVDTRMLHLEQSIEGTRLGSEQSLEKRFETMYTGLDELVESWNKSHATLLAQVEGVKGAPEHTRKLQMRVQNLEAQVENQQHDLGQMRDWGIAIKDAEDSINKFKEDQEKLGKRCTHLKTQMDSLDKICKSLHSEQKESSRPPSASSGRNPDDLQRLEAQIDALKKKRDSDYQTTKHRLDGLSSNQQTQEKLKAVETKIAEVEARVRPLAASNDRVHRMEESSKALTKRLEGQILELAGRIDAGAAKVGVDEGLRKDHKRVEREAAETRRKIEGLHTTIVQLKEEVNCEASKQREQIKVFTNKNDSKMRDLTTKLNGTVDMVKAMEERDATVATAELSGKLDRVRSKLEGMSKDFTSRQGELYRRLESLESVDLAIEFNKVEVDIHQVASRCDALALDLDKQRDKIALQSQSMALIPDPALPTPSRDFNSTVDQQALEDLHERVYALEKQVEKVFSRTDLSLDQLGQLKGEVRPQMQKLDEIVRRIEGDQKTISGDLKKLETAHQEHRATTWAVQAHNPEESLEMPPESYILPPSGKTRRASSVPRSASAPYNMAQQAAIVGRQDSADLPPYSPPPEARKARSPAPQQTPKHRQAVSLGIDIAEGKHFQTQEYGIYITKLHQGSFNDAGLMPNDMITAWNGIEISTKDALASCVQEAQPGDEVEVRIVRNKGSQSITHNVRVTLQAKTGNTPKASARAKSPQPEGNSGRRSHTPTGTMRPVTPQNSGRSASPVVYSPGRPSQSPAPGYEPPQHPQSTPEPPPVVIAATEQVRSTTPVRRVVNPFTQPRPQVSPAPDAQAIQYPAPSRGGMESPAPAQDMYVESAIA